MKRTLALGLVCALLSISVNLLSVLSQNSPQNSRIAGLDGFSAEASAIERRWEEEFQRVPAPNSSREHLRRLTAQPHVAGTKEGYATAIYVRDKIRSYGIPSELKEYDVLLNYPNSLASWS